MQTSEDDGAWPCGVWVQFDQSVFCQVQNTVFLVAHRAPSYIMIAKYGSSAGVFPLLCLLPRNAVNKLYEYGIKSSECLADSLGLLKGLESRFNASRNHLKGRVIGLLYLPIIFYQRWSALQYTSLSVYCNKNQITGRAVTEKYKPMKICEWKKQLEEVKILWWIFLIFHCFLFRTSPFKIVQLISFLEGKTKQSKNFLFLYFKLKSSPFSLVNLLKNKVIFWKSYIW